MLAGRTYLETKFSYLRRRLISDINQLKNKTNSSKIRAEPIFLSSFELKINIVLRRLIVVVGAYTKPVFAWRDAVKLLGACRNPIDFFDIYMSLALRKKLDEICSVTFNTSSIECLIVLMLWSSCCAPSKTNSQCE